MGANAAIGLIGGMGVIGGMGASRGITGMGGITGIGAIGAIAGIGAIGGMGGIGISESQNRSIAAGGAAGRGVRHGLGGVGCAGGVGASWEKASVAGTTNNPVITMILLICVIFQSSLQLSFFFLRYRLAFLIAHLRSQYPHFEQ